MGEKFQVRQKSALLPPVDLKGKRACVSRSPEKVAHGDGFLMGALSFGKRTQPSLSELPKRRTGGISPSLLLPSSALLPAFAIN